MDSETPGLRIVPAPHPEVTQGTERIVAELVEITTRRMVGAYVDGFKLGVSEALRIVRDAGALAPGVDEKITELLDTWAATEGESGE